MKNTTAVCHVNGGVKPPKNYYTACCLMAAGVFIPLLMCGLFVL